MVKIIADTLSGLPVALAHKLGIPYMPQIVIFGNESYRDDTEIDSKTFLARLRASSALPKTAAPPPSLYTPVYEQLLSEGHSIVVLCPSADVSGTYRSAQVAAQDFPGADIHVVDTRTIAASLGNVVLEAHKWALEGCDAETIIARVHEMVSRERIYVVVDTLEYLYKGGRIGGAKMLVGSLLQVKPILQFKNGRIEPVEQQRTKRRGIARLKELVAADCPQSPDAHLTILQGGAEEEAHVLACELQDQFGLEEEIPIQSLPPAILVHAGPGVLGAAYFVAPNSQEN
ncbi:MAG TPA: DegV family protein [Chloroflexi bacterium]|nr:DegV family protein [Chloroflexota bacterium]HPO58182.1 DegV family protein [Anaerolineaceae bacterium]